jgi:DNA-binding MarR family transcriptional regulator
MAESRNETGIILGVLTAVEGNASVSQRTVAKELGIALGLANAYVKRCVKKGLIKAQQIPANRIAYYLTPQGFAEKSRLTAEYLSQGLQFFRIAREDMNAVYADAVRASHQRVMLYGLTELTEIAVLSARDYALTITAIFDDSTPRTVYHGIPVIRALPDPREFDVIVITDLGGAQKGFETVSRVVPSERILLPAILHVSRTPPTLALEE